MEEDDMTSDQKIDELLRIVQSHEVRFDRLEGKFDRLEAKVDEQAEKSLDRDHKLLLLIQEQGERHDRRFAQMDDRFAQFDDRFTQLEKRLTAKIDQVFSALSQDISVFVEDLYELKDRMDRSEKKPLS
jgi:hypothetical protein